ncbi:MAG TPA: Gfo/Idh/MocA family oxidoreductase, partial [Gemmatimonadales bacterium]|nr:Gfo/Idh/MocA family oxidoreductase [Gemmatimonadales bacterium]
MAATRVGIVGAGAITQLAHLPVLSRLRNVTVQSLCDNDAAKVRALADRFEVPDTYSDIEDMLNYGKLDAVVVATPN